MCAIEMRIELIGIGEAPQRALRIALRRAEAVLLRQPARHVEILELGIIAAAREPSRQPPVMQLHQRVDLAADRAELMEVIVARPRPAAEPDAELESAVRVEN